jgi:hypothetical protein
MTAALLAGAVVCAAGFLTAVRRHDRYADAPLRPFSRPVVVEGLWLAPAIGLGFAGLAALLSGLLP